MRLISYLLKPYNFSVTSIILKLLELAYTNVNIGYITAWLYSLAVD